jgi:hypothetical protein
MTEQPTAYPGYGNYGTATQPDATRPTRRPLAWNGGTDIGLLLLRVGIGGAAFAHGAQKVFGLWGGPGITAFAANLETFGYQQSTTLSWATGVTELVAGAFVVLDVGFHLREAMQARQLEAVEQPERGEAGSLGPVAGFGLLERGGDARHQRIGRRRGAPQAEIGLVRHQQRHQADPEKCPKDHRQRPFAREER